MSTLPKVLIFSGIILITIGLLWHFLGGTGIPLGRLPGDIKIEGKHGTFYFPLTTSILLSIILTLIGYLWRLFK